MESTEMNECDGYKMQAIDLACGLLVLPEERLNERATCLENKKWLV